MSKVSVVLFVLASFAFADKIVFLEQEVPEKCKDVVYQDGVFFPFDCEVDMQCFTADGELMVQFGGEDGLVGFFTEFDSKKTSILSRDDISRLLKDSIKCRNRREVKKVLVR